MCSSDLHYMLYSGCCAVGITVEVHLLQRKSHNILGGMLFKKSRKSNPINQLTGRIELAGRVHVTPNSLQQEVTLAKYSTIDSRLSTL